MSPEDLSEGDPACRGEHVVLRDAGRFFDPEKNEYDIRRERYRRQVIGDDVPGDIGLLAARVATVAATGYLAVTGQTCDIAIGGPGQRHSFVQVSPVRDIGSVFDSGEAQQIREGFVVENVYLTYSPLASAAWAVDLRISVPMSKAVLARLEPIKGFLSEEDELAFSKSIAAKLRRLALMVMSTPFGPGRAA